MENKMELLLVNSISPRQRIASDAALENGLAILRTYLENRGYSVDIVDDQRVTMMEAGVPSWCLALLRNMVGWQMQSYNKSQKRLWTMLMLATWPIQALSLHYRRAYINRRIDDVIAMIKEKKIAFLGIKVWYGDAFTWSKLLAARVRVACPDTIIIAGGPHVKVYGEHILDTADYDVAIMGPGEEVLEKMMLLRRQVPDRQAFLAAFHNEFGDSRFIKAGIYNTGAASREPVFTIPHYRPEDMEGKILFHTLVDGLGCSWNKCNFCSHTRQKETYRARPVAEIIREIEAITGQGISFFRFSSSETPFEHGKKIAEEILKQGLKVNFSMFVRAVKVTPEVYEAYRLMIRAGLRAVFMGGETGHDLINEKVMNKGIHKKELVDTINCIKLAAYDVGENCRIGLSLIYPCPVIEGVTLQDVFQENLSLIQAANPDTVIVNPPGVFPETQWMEHAAEYGFSIHPDFVARLMEYEYSIYKPTELWEELGYSLQGMSGSELLSETGKLRKAVMDMGIPTDISDEYLMMTEAIGYKTKPDLLKFKSGSLQDIMAGSSSYMKNIVAKINFQSRQMALRSQGKQ